VVLGIEDEFDEFLAKKFPNIELDQEQIDEFYDFWLDGYHKGAEDHY
jgi:hypothetical protein